MFVLRHGPSVCLSVVCPSVCLSSVRLSVCRLSVSLLHPTQKIELTAVFFAPSNSLETWQVLVKFGQKFQGVIGDHASKMEGYEQVALLS